MTATTKPPDGPSATPRRRVRFSSLEALGFTDVTSSWSDTPLVSGPSQRGQHLAPAPEPGTVADWQPQDFGPRLGGSNVRWSVVVAIILLLGGIGGLGYWMYQRPAEIERAAAAEAHAQARALDSALLVLFEFNNELLVEDTESSTEGLDTVERVARALFDTSGRLAQVDLRSLTSQAAVSSLDGIRLARETDAYRSAVISLLDAPQLETDRDLVELDEAARMFGNWQLGFDETRTALPDDVLPQVTEQLDILSAELTSFLRRYLDALLVDDPPAAQNVLTALGSRLDAIEEDLVDSMEDVQARVELRLEETRIALDRILAG
jgi:hypothetical protein